MRALAKALKNKKVYSRFSNTLITFVDALGEIENQEGAFSDGMLLYDSYENVVDDIQQMYFVLKDGSICNCEDFYSTYGATPPGAVHIIEAIKKYVAER